MSSTSNIQNVLSNVVRPVYVYDPATSNYSAKVIISNVDTFSVKTIEVENLEFGDANSNVYLGIDAGSENSNSRRNVGVGVGAAQNNVNTKNSVFVGYAAGGENITDASASVVLGASTLSGGSSNVYVGFGTGSSASNASGNIFLGPNLTMAIPLSNEIRIGNGSNIPFSANMNNRYIGLNTATPNYELDVSADTANFQGDVRITGSLRVAGSGGLESAQPSAVELGNGDTATGSGNRSTISFQSNTGGYRHMIRSRHDASSSPTTTNAVDIFVNTSATATGSSQPGTGNVLGLSVTAAGVGVGVSNPAYALDVSGTVRAGAIVTSGGATTLGDVVLSNGTVKLYDGSSNAPTLTFQNDTSLGLYRSGANMLTVASAGSNRMTFSNANVGIGTLNPAYSLDVCGIVRATGFIGTSGSGSSGGVVFSNGGVALSNGTVSDPALTFQSDLSLGMYRIGANQVGFVSAGSNRMTISNGNVGIGTTTPQILLDLSSATADQGITITAVNAQVNLSNPGVAPLQLYNNGSTQGLFTNNVLPLSLWTNGGRRLNILSNGNVGIGFTDASHALDVNGTTRTSNALVSGYLRNALTPTQFDMSGGTLFLSNRIITGAGTVSAPAHTFLNDASMGLYDPATNTLGLVTSGVERMRIASNGFVGIGTTAPLGTLHIGSGGIVVNQLGNITANTDVSMIVEGSSNAGMYLQKGSNNNAGGLSFKTAVGGVLGERMRIDGNTGFVGIGTQLPATALDVCATNQVLTLTSTATTSPTPIATVYQPNLTTTSPSNYTYQLFGVNASSSNAVAGLFTYNGSGSASNSYRMYIQGSTGGITMRADGNVGIGTTAPTYALDVCESVGVATRFITAQFRNTNASGQAAINVTGGGIADTSGLRFFHNLALNAQGIYNSNLLPFYIYTNNVERLTILSNGNVGIGTTAPVTRLHMFPRVVDDASFPYDTSSLMVVHPTPTSTTALNDPRAVLYLARQGTSAQSFGAMASFKLSRFENSGTDSRTRMDVNLTHASFTEVPVMTMRSDGRVGIGTVGPTRSLDVSLSGTNYIRIGGAVADQQGLEFADSAQRWVLYKPGNTTALRLTDGTTDRVTFSNGGNVGIGTTAPAARLDISGGDPTVIVRNTSGTSKITLVGSNGTDATGMMLTHHGTIEQAIYSSNTLPFHIYTNGLKRLTVLSSGLIGVGTTAPGNGFQLSSNVGGIYNNAYDGSENMVLLSHRAFRVETAVGASGHFGNLYLFTDVSFTNSTVTNSAGAVCFGSQNSEFGGFNVVYARVSGVKVGSFYGGLSFATMHNSNDGVLRENVRIQNGQMGIGTSAPAYTLDISTAPTAASINMTTWPRTTASISYYGVYSSSSNAAAIWTTSNAIDSNIMTVGSNAGTYFTVNRTGLYNFSVYLGGTDAGNATVFIDCSTNIAHSAIDRTQHTILANNVVVPVVNGGAVSLTSVFTGVLPSNSGIYYKVKASAILPSAGRAGGRFVITFLGEAPAVTGFPF